MRTSSDQIAGPREAAEDRKPLTSKQAKAIVLVVDNSLTGGVTTQADIGRTVAILEKRIQRVVITPGGSMIALATALNFFPGFRRANRSICISRCGTFSTLNGRLGILLTAPGLQGVNPLSGRWRRSTRTALSRY